MASKSKRQQTAAKRNREHAVREKRELKQQKKLAAAADKRMRAEDPSITLTTHEDELSEHRPTATTRLTPVDTPDE